MRLSSLILSTIATYAAAEVVADSTLSSPSQTVSGLESSAPSANMAVGPDEKTKYIFSPLDGTNEEAVKKTETNILRITEQSKIFSYREKSNNNKLRLWVVNVTDIQLQEIKKDEGIKSAEMNYVSEKAFDSLPLPADAPHLPHALPKKARRAIEYTTQSTSGLESSAPSATMAVSQDGKTEYGFFPVNGTDEEALAKTESNIQKITQLPKVFSYREKSNNNTLSFWLVSVTDTQLQEIKKDEGIDDAEMNIYEKVNAFLPPPTDAPRLPHALPIKDNRAIE